MFELSLITMFVFNNAVSYSSLTVYHNHNKKRTEWKQAQWSTFSDPPKNLPLSPQSQRHTQMQKINDLSGIHGARLDAHALTLPLSHVLPVNPWRFTDETYNFSPTTKHPISHLQYAGFHSGSRAGLSYYIFASEKGRNLTLKRWRAGRRRRHTNSSSLTYPPRVSDTLSGETSGSWSRHAHFNSITFVISITF